MQEVPHVSSAVVDPSAGRWAIALVVTAAFMVGGGFLGYTDSAQAAGKPGDNAGSPGRDGQSVTCHTHQPPRDDMLVCNAVAGNGADGKDGAPAAVHR
ncbi:hypothetical protein GCM10009609_18360 [Pseudonocardia aurantiaca]